VSRKRAVRGEEGSWGEGDHLVTQLAANANPVLEKEAYMANIAASHEGEAAKDAVGEGEGAVVVGHVEAKLYAGAAERTEAC